MPGTGAVSRIRACCSPMISTSPVARSRSIASSSSRIRSAAAPGRLGCVVVPVVWRSISGEGETVPLYPSAAEWWVTHVATGLP